MIKLNNVCKSFDSGKTFAVDHFSLSIAEGELMVLLGTSGCGKTTTLKMINRLVEPSAGNILVDNKNIMQCSAIGLRRSIGYAFQGIGLFQHMTVTENIEVVPRLLGWNRIARRKRAEELLAMIGLDPVFYSNRLPEDLSGGQQQRVGVARALAANPKYLLMDEPFGALDAITRDGLQQEILKLKATLGVTIIFVTHDILEALTLADRIAVLHLGKLQQVGTGQEILQRPANEFVRQLFVKHANQVQAFGRLQ